MLLWFTSEFRKINPCGQQRLSRRYHLEYKKPLRTTSRNQLIKHTLTLPRVQEDFFFVFFFGFSCNPCAFLWKRSYLMCSPFSEANTVLWSITSTYKSICFLNLTCYKWDFAAKSALLTSCEPGILPPEKMNAPCQGAAAGPWSVHAACSTFKALSTNSISCFPSPALPLYLIIHS